MMICIPATPDSTMIRHGMDDVRCFSPSCALAALVLPPSSSASIARRRAGASRRSEKSMGATLFLRTREGLRPSAIAERMLPHAERMEAEARALTSTAVAGDREVAGTVRVATTEALAGWLVQEGLLGVRDAHPSLVIELLGGNRPVDLVRGEADLRAAHHKDKEAALRVRQLGKLSFALFASPSYLRRRGQPRNESEARRPRRVRTLRRRSLAVARGQVAVSGRAFARSSGRAACRPSPKPSQQARSRRPTRAWGDGHPGLDIARDRRHPAAPLWLVSPGTIESANVRVVAAKIREIVARVGVARFFPSRSRSLIGSSRSMEPLRRHGGSDPPRRLHAQRRVRRIDRRW